MTNKIKMLISIFIFISIYSLTVGYSAFSTNLRISGNAYVRVDDEIRINNVKIKEVINNGYETYNNKYSKNTTNFFVTLPNNNSSVSYEITIKNKSSFKYQLLDILEENNTNTTVKYKIDGFSKGMIFEANEEKTFVITFTTPVDNQVLELMLKYEFKKYEQSEAGTTAGDINEGTQENQPDFENIATENETNEGLFRSVDDYGEVFYYRGDVTNNYVKFAGFYWRIIRINGDGSIRMIYDGTYAHDNGNKSTDRYIGTSSWSSNKEDNKFVGYMYGNSSNSYNNATTNTNSNTIKTYLENWYVTNIKNKGFDELVSDTLFCNDRSITSGLGYGNNQTVYKGNTRVEVDKNPSLKCENTNDRFTVSAAIGNRNSSEKIGLITADEVVLAGGKTWVDDSHANNNKNFYLYCGYSYWTMTPYIFGIYDDSARNFYVNENGHIGTWYLTNNGGVRPVINIKAEVARTMPGTGTKTNPYIVDLPKPPAEETLAILGLGIKSNTPNFKYTSTSNDTSTSLYKTADNYGESFYYRGNITNNYVKFAGFYWRIIRINGDGTLRIIYDGTTGHSNTTKSTDRLGITNTEFNITLNDAKSIGYMFGETSTSYQNATTNAIDSSAKKALDNWYKTNIYDKGYDQYVNDTLFCNDRDLESGSGFDDGTTTFYKPRTRLYVSKNPSLMCNTKNNSFTVNDTVNGNGNLTYPIGMITADEAVMAGGKFGSNNTRYFLYTGYDYYTMSGYQTYQREAQIFYINNYGQTRNSYVSYKLGIRPVLNLKKEYVKQMTGNGTINNPYTK